MKIAVYAIAKNEEKHLERWFNSCKDADEIIILDTGSTDRTFEMARSMDIKTYRHIINPWRFDLARNAALSLVPEDVDYCLALDLDEYLIDGWRDIDINPFVDRPKYHMSLISNGSNPLRYWANRMHRRHGYFWSHTIHERLNFMGSDEVVDYLNIKVIHEPDMLKERNYIEELERQSRRYSDDVRYGMLYARELINLKNLKDAHREFLRVLSIENHITNLELADIYRYMGLCGINPLEDFKRSLEYGNRRETLIDIAGYHSNRFEWEPAMKYFDQAFDIIDEPYDFISMDYAWGPRPYSQAAMAAMNNMEFSRAIDYLNQGLSLHPDDPQLASDFKLVEVNSILAA
jgi:glycosyltransferase involved in cell wall biosynthesis